MIKMTLEEAYKAVMDSTISHAPVMLFESQVASLKRPSF